MYPPNEQCSVVHVVSSRTRKAPRPDATPTVGYSTPYPSLEPARRELEHRRGHLQLHSCILYWLLIGVYGPPRPHAPHSLHRTKPKHVVPARPRVAARAESTRHSGALDTCLRIEEGLRGLGGLLD